jgi:tRNA(adenine34) deaminase
MKSDFEAAMREALQQARLAGESGDVPVGAVVLHEGEVIASRHNERELTNDPTAHAEILALRDAAQTLGTWRLTECTLVVTLEPCVMCAGASYWTQISRIVYGARDEKRGFSQVSDRIIHPKTEVLSDVRSEEAASLMKDFFISKRNKL